jgi:hypothetical protein
VSAPPVTTSELTCPECGQVSAEIMPLDACIYFFDCVGCGKVSHRGRAQRGAWDAPRCAVPFFPLQVA